MKAAGDNNVVVVKANLQDLKKQNDKGQTALMFAARRGAMESTVLLMEEAGMQNKKGYSAMMIAAENGFIQMVKKLCPSEKGLLTNKGESAKILA